MKVAVLVNYFFPYRSGLTEYVYQLCSTMKQMGLDVEVHCWKNSKDSLMEEILDGICVHRYSGILNLDKGIISPRYMRKLMFGLGEYDLIMPVMPMAEAALPYFFNSKKRILPVYVCDIQLGRSFLSRIIEFLSYSSMRFATGRSSTIIALSYDYAQNSPVIGQYLRRVVPIAPPIRVEERQREDFSEFLAHYQLDPSRRRIGFLGRIVSEKGLDVLIDAAGRNADFFKDTDILLAGNSQTVAGGSIRKSLEKMISKNISVKFLDFIPGPLMNQFYSSLNLFVMPSTMRLEAYGIVQVEAMLCGTPVVTTKLSGVREPVSITKFGELCEPGNPDSLFEAIQLVLKNSAKYKLGRSEVIAKLGLDRSQALIQKVIGDFLASRGQFIIKDSLSSDSGDQMKLSLSKGS